MCDWLLFNNDTLISRNGLTDIMWRMETDDPVIWQFRPFIWARELDEWYRTTPNRNKQTDRTGNTHGLSRKQRQPLINYFGIYIEIAGKS